MSNILENIEFSSEKANVFSIKKTDKIKYFAVALGKDAVLKKHTAPVPTTLVMIKGEIKFGIGDEELHFKEFDTFEIPINAEHEVIGLNKENVFTLLQEL